MTRYFLIPVLALSLFPLASCQTAKTHSQKNASAPVKQDFLTTGRGLSKGAVDLYQPGTDFLPTAQYPNAGPRGGASAVPGNPNIAVNDPSVTIYSLDSIEARYPQPAPLPPLQPPSVTRADYPSPFDKNGNFTK